MSAETDWQEANSRHLSAAVAWVRARLAALAPPAAEAAPSAQRRFPWERAPAPRAPAHTARDPASLLADMTTIARGMSPPPALQVLARQLSLTPFERDLLLLCAAVELDTGVAALCARAQGPVAEGEAARSWPTFALGMSLFDDPSWDALSPDRPLRYWRLLEISQPGATPLTVSPLRADERIVNFIKGVTYVEDRLAPFMAPLPTPPADEAPASARAAADAITQALAAADADGGQPPVIQLLGSDASSLELVAGLASAQLGLRAYRLDWTLLASSPAELEASARLWQREALLLPLALYLHAEAGEAAQTAVLERLLTRVGGVVFLGARELWAGPGRPPIVAEVGKPTYQEQRALWAEALDGEADNAPDELASQFNLDAATIRDVAGRIGPAGEAPRFERLWDACRALTRPRLDALAQRLKPRGEWDALVLPADETALLHRIADQVGRRGRVYRDWGFAARMGRGLGISALFAGTSGTGKTMAAEVLANELRLDLFRIDLSAVVSKYIGETEKNLRRLFDAAEDGGAILFFDEADALFGKRSEVKESHDRYANIEINYLLQRMEQYGGLAILATNMKSALDPAFMRRLRFVVDFPFPGVPERQAMWRRAFPPDTPTQGLDFARLAQLNVTGGYITVIALNAAFQAAQAGAPVSMPMVLEAARIEYRKLGRPMAEADFRWTGAAA
jgi:hypothetical protein